ncbi:hypothetical protein AL060_05625 [Pseudomonas syringae pv. rhaphiolepidis]|nr:hypothetical protein AL060_05625 [Pseudomonas syringae pv. rhaphiolepidis]
MTLSNLFHVLLRTTERFRFFLIATLAMKSFIYMASIRQTWKPHHDLITQIYRKKPTRLTIASWPSAHAAFAAWSPMDTMMREASSCASNSSTMKT